MTSTDVLADWFGTDEGPDELGAAAPATPGGAAARPARPWAWIVAVLVGQAVVLWNPNVPVLRPILGAALLIGVPVLALCRRPLARRCDPLPAFLYATAAAFLAIIVGGLALNTVLPWAAVDRPLALPVLVIASTLVDLALVAQRSEIPLMPPGFARRAVASVVGARVDPAVALGVAAVVLSVAGAVRLNNGHGGAVAVTAHFVVVGALGAALLRRGAPARNRVATVYLAGAALLFGTSLRGWYITGHDIQNEYLAYLLTHSQEHWVMSAYPQPYNACLSVNILPSVLTDYLGVSGVFVFKVVAQLVFALVPVAVYVSARRMLSARLSVLASAIFMFFPTYFTDMPFLMRQEIAYLFVVSALLAATQPGFSVRARQAATFAFGVGVVLSHYSTTYVMIITLVLGLCGAAAGRLWQAGRQRRFRAWAARARHARPQLPHRRRAPLVLLGPAVVVLLAVTAWAWSTPATHSAGHLADTVNKLTESIIHGNAQAGSSDLNYSIFGGGGPSPEERFRQYENDALTDRVGDAAQFVFGTPTGTVKNPPLAERDDLPLTAAGRLAQDAGVDVAGANDALKSFAAALFQLFLVIGLLALMLHAKLTRRLQREQFWLVLASVGALGAVVVVPGLSADYGVLRAFQQTLLFAAPLLAVGVVTATQRLRRVGPALAAGLTLSIGAILTGAVPALLGGYYAVLSQSNSGQYYDLLYTDTQQVATGQWLAATTADDPYAGVTASDIVSITRLQFYLPKRVGVSGEFLPSQLRKDAYVYFGPQTAVHGQATVFYTGDLLTYTYPTAALGQRLDLIYSTGQTEIFR